MATMDNSSASPAVADDAKTRFQKTMQHTGRGHGPACKTSVDSAHDELALQYSALADDGSLGGNQREAAMLYSAAEAHLAEELSEEALKAAQDALERFRDLADAAGVVDTLLVIIRTHILEAQASNADPTQALQIATEELAQYRSSGDKRGEGCMLLAQAEARSASRGFKNQVAAVDEAGEAVSIFREIDDKKMAATALIELATYQYFRGHHSEIQSAAQEALTVAKDLGEEKLEAKALHALALSYELQGDYDQMLRLLKDSLLIYRKLGERRKEAFELSVIAIVHLWQDKPQRALPAAKEGLKIVQEVKHAGMVPEARLLLLVVESQLGIQRKMQALKAAKAGLSRFQGLGDKRGVTYGLEILLYTQMELDNFEEAVKAGEDGLSVAREFGEKRMELDLHFLLSLVHLRRDQPETALETMQDALSLAQELEDLEEEGNVQNMISDIYLTEPQLQPDEGEAGKDALQAADEAKALFSKAGDRVSEAHAVVTTAFGHSLNGDNEKAASTAAEALAIFEEEEDARGQSLALNLIMELELIDGKYDDALKTGQKRIDLWEEIGNKKEAGYGMLSLAQAHIQGENLREALSVITDAQASVRALDNKRLDVHLLLALTQVHLGTMNKEDAGSGDASRPPSKAFTEARQEGMKAATQAVTLSGKVNDRELRASAMYWRASVLMWSSNLADAMRHANQAAKLFKEIRMEANESQALTLVAYAQYRYGKKAEALKTVGTALELARKAKNPASEEAAMEAIDVIEERNKNQPVVQEVHQVQQIQQFEPQQQQQVQQVSAPVPAKPKGLDPLMVKTKLMSMVKDVMASDDELEVDSPFMEAGMDSLSSVSLMSAVAKEFQMSLSPSLVFDFPTVRALQEHLVEESKSVAY